MKRNSILILTAAVLALLVALPARAQKLPEFTLVDETRTLDYARIEQAARPLIEQDGATVVIYMLNQGGPEDFAQRLETDNFLNNTGNPWQGLIAIYVIPGNAMMRFDTEWDRALMADNTYQQILQTHLAPALAAGDPTTGFVNTLGAIQQAVEAPSTRRNTESTIFYIFVGILCVALVVGALWLGARSRRQQEQAAQQGSG